MRRTILFLIISLGLVGFFYQKGSTKNVFHPQQLTPVLTEWIYQDDDFLKFSSLYSWLNQKNPDLEFTVQVMGVSPAAKKLIVETLTVDDQDEFTRGRSGLAYILGYSDFEMQKIKPFKISNFPCVEFLGNMSKPGRQVDFYETQCLIGNHHFAFVINGNHSLESQIQNRTLIESVIKNVGEL